MHSVRAFLIALTCVAAARADFSYTQTRKSAAGVIAGAAGNLTMKHYQKGQKLKTENSFTSTIIDVDAQTVTTINHQQKTYTVTSFANLPTAVSSAGANTKVDVKETGQKKNINGYNASEVLMTMEVDAPQSTGGGSLKMMMETSMWLSSDPPGAQELRAFYQRNSDKFPWAAMASGQGNAGLQKAMAEMQKKIASLGGVPVLQVMKMKMGNDAQNAQMQQSLERARAQAEAMKKQGGPQAKAAEELLARIGPPGGGGSLFEMRMEATGFSTATIPDSVFTVPADYQKK